MSKTIKVELIWMTKDNSHRAMEYISTAFPDSINTMSGSPISSYRIRIGDPAFVFAVLEDGRKMFFLSGSSDTEREIPFLYLYRESGGEIAIDQQKRRIHHDLIPFVADVVKTTNRMKGAAMSISSHVMLVTLATGSVQRTKVDRETTQKVNQDKHAEHGSGTVTKNLWPSYVLNAVSQATAGFEQYHKQVTFPYHGVRGVKILPAVKFLEHSQRFALAKQALSDALVEIAPNDAAYQQLLDACKRSRGDFFDPDDYPATASQFASEFVIDVDYIPLSDGDSVLERYSEVLKGREEELLRMAEERMEKSRSEGVRDIFDRFRKPLRRIVDVLSADTEKRVYSSMVDEVKAMIEMVPVFNAIIKDPRLEQWHGELLSLMSMDTEVIRNQSVEARKDRAKQAEELLKKLDSYAV